MDEQLDKLHDATKHAEPYMADLLHDIFDIVYDNYGSAREASALSEYAKIACEIAPALQKQIRELRAQTETLRATADRLHTAWREAEAENNRLRESAEVSEGLALAVNALQAENDRLAEKLGALRQYLKTSRIRVSVLADLIEIIDGAG